MGDAPASSTSTIVYVQLPTVMPFASGTAVNGNVDTEPRSFDGENVVIVTVPE